MKKSIFIIALCGSLMSMNAQSNKKIFLNNDEQKEYSKVRGNNINVIYKTPEGTKQTLNYEEIYFIISKRTVYVPGKLNNLKFLKPRPMTMDIKDIDPNESRTKGKVDAIANNNFTGAKIGGGITGFFFLLDLLAPL